jgi:hypothetical protein
MTIEEVPIALIAVALWLAYAAYMNARLRLTHEKLDRVLEEFNGLREYLYEIDPQFDDERLARDAHKQRKSVFSGMNDQNLLRMKRKAGKRTLSTPFVGRQSYRQSSTEKK